MIFDFNEKGFQADEQYDIAIVGAGAAGITLARSLINSNYKVCVLEAGGKIPSLESQDIYKGKNTGRDYFNLDQARLRFLGGTTNHWEGFCIPLEAEDFQAREDIDAMEGLTHDGWPIPYSDFSKFLVDASEMLGLGGHTFDSDLLQYMFDGEPPFEEKRFEMASWRQSPPTHRFLRLSQEKILADASNIHLYLNANVTHIQHHENKPSIEHLQVRSFGGRKATLKAKEYVIACGGVETPRLMLASNDKLQAGIGNQSGLVGRYFMEHVEVYSGHIISDNTEMDKYLSFANHKYPTPEGVRVHTGFTLSPEDQKKLGVLNCSLAVQTMRNPTSAITAVKSLSHDIKAGEWPDKAFTNLWRVISGLDTLYDEWQTRKGNGDNSEDMVTGLFARSEQAPNYNSYVKLDPSAKDQFGVPRLEMHWQLAEIDLETIKKTTEAFGAELARQKLGRVKLLDWVAEKEWGLDTVGGYHHLGTTKMGDNPSTSVVDGNLKVHGLDNMSILGSSVFPTGGFANPTLSIVALAFRLGDHFKSRA